jgi:hypothetical protein
MAGPRPLVPPPAFVPGQYGLLSVVQPRYEEPDVHWRNGVTYQGTCGDGDTTFDDFCVTGEGAPAKSANINVTTRGATPFVAMVKIDCSTVGYTEDEHRQRALDALSRVEGYQVEQTFWTGVVAGDSGGYVAYPHLAANAAVFDSPGSLLAVQMQTAVTQVTGAVLDITEALGRLEDALGDCVIGQAVVHMTPAIAAQAFSRGLLKASGNRMQTLKGNLVAIGDGYTGSSPTGVVPTGAHWMYGTGQIFAYRGNSRIIAPAFSEIIDRDDNSVPMIAERTYVLGWDCCHVGTLVSLGGEIAGRSLGDIRGPDAYQYSLRRADPGDGPARHQPHLLRRAGHRYRVVRDRYGRLRAGSGRAAVRHGRPQDFAPGQRATLPQQEASGRLHERSAHGRFLPLEPRPCRGHHWRPADHGDRVTDRHRHGVRGRTDR